MAKIIKESNPYDLKSYEEAPFNYISGEELLSLMKKNDIEITNSNIPRFASNNKIKMVKVKRIGREGSVPTYYQKPSKNKIDKIFEILKNNNNSFIGREFVIKKTKEILRIFDNAKDKSVSKTSIAKSVTKILDVSCDREFVAKVLNEKRSEAQIRKKMIKFK